MKNRDLEFGNEMVKIYDGLTDEEKVQTWVGMRNLTQQWAAGKIAQKGVTTLLIGGLVTVAVIKISNKRRERKAKEAQVIY